MGDVHKTCVGYGRTSEAGESLVGGAVSARQTIADELYPAVEIGDLDQPLALCEVDGADLHAVAPVGDSEFENEGKLRGQRGVEAWGGW